MVFYHDVEYKIETLQADDVNHKTTLKELNMLPYINFYNGTSATPIYKSKLDTILRMEYV
jgi:hypothetical protein